MNARTNSGPSAAERIRQQLDRVSHLRTQARSGGLSTAVHDIKQLQARRFRASYADFLSDRRHAPASAFFLDELYGEHDFSERDAQFGRIASAIERLFPEAVAHLAVDLAETHALTESLDHRMAAHWMALDGRMPYTERYVRCWRLTDDRQARERQLAVVLHMGQELQRLTRMKSLLVALRLMRGPAQAAGLGALQQFLERGFSAFANMGDASRFLDAIAEREQRWIDALFDAEVPACQAALAQELLRA